MFNLTIISKTSILLANAFSINFLVFFYIFEANILLRLHFFKILIVFIKTRGHKTV